MPLLVREMSQLSLFDEGLLSSESAVWAAASALGAATVAGSSPLEEKFLQTNPRGIALPARLITDLRRRVAAGHDPLGESFTRIRSAAERRPLGATYTPQPIVSLMLDWASELAVANKRQPTRIVDPGAGSGRFLLEAGRRFPKAILIGVEIDPLAAVVARANLAAAGMAGRSQILLGDYRTLLLPTALGATLFVGNPPYVRHHLIPTEWKEWLSAKAGGMNLSASQLAGLHVHFFLATALLARAGDFGAFITAAEWLDVNYGKLVRDLFLGPLGGHHLLVLEPTARAFPDAATTAAIATFIVGEKPSSIRLNRVDSLDDVERIGEGRNIARERLVNEARWSHFTRPVREARENHVELGELCRVHRGSVTGANKVWIAGDHSVGIPASALFPAVTRARELFAAGVVLADPAPLRRVIDLPPDLDEFASDERRAIHRFLRYAREQKVHLGYIASHRKNWWSIGLRTAPPIMATYMARRPPAFVRNLAGAKYINIAHGLYPRQPMTETALLKLASYLSTATRVTEGRTYAGGLTKFEPREMERILVPEPDLLASGVC